MVAKQEKEERCSECAMENAIETLCKSCQTEWDNVKTKKFYTEVEK